MNQLVTKVDELDAVTRTIQQYIAGAKSGRSDDMKPAFHEDATVYGYVGVDLLAGHIKKLFDWNDNNGPATELLSQIASIDIVDTVATVRLELENWTGLRFTDLFTLLKLEGNWKIVNKVFHTHS